MRDGEDKAGAREGREELCCASHGELQLRRVVAAAETQMGPLPWVLRLDGEMEYLGEVKAELSANWRWQFCGDERARRRRLLGVDGGAGALLLLRESAAAKEMKNGRASWSGRRAGCSRLGQQRQEARGAWPARAEGQRRVSLHAAVRF